ncbi:MAG: nitrous oxide reductase accessory protein NosL [Candidatus Caldarchaeum sp.]
MRYVAFVFLILIAASCGKERGEVKPVTVYYGEDICDLCKMIISEEEFSAQAVLEGGGAAKFDDIGCAMHYLKVKPQVKVVAIFVRDYGTKEWIRGEGAYYVVTNKVKTPMGHGIVAFRERATAERLAGEKEGRVIEGFDAAAMWLMEGHKDG